MFGMEPGMAGTRYLTAPAKPACASTYDYALAGGATMDAGCYAVHVA
jgi:hypothetical protein